MCIDGSLNRSPEETIRLAKAAAARALELDNELGDVHGISGLIQFAFDFDWRGAERSFLRAIELSPGSAQVHEHYSWLCTALERYDDALREVRRARELDPILIRSDVATTLLRAGRVEEALDEARRSIQDDPAATRSHSVLGWALIFHGEKAAGIASLEKAVAAGCHAVPFPTRPGLRDDGRPRTGAAYTRTTARPGDSRICFAVPLRLSVFRPRECGCRSRLS